MILFHNHSKNYIHSPANDDSRLILSIIITSNKNASYTCDESRSLHLTEARCMSIDVAVTLVRCWGRAQSHRNGSVGLPCTPAGLLGTKCPANGVYASVNASAHVYKVWWLEGWWEGEDGDISSSSLPCCSWCICLCCFCAKHLANDICVSVDMSACVCEVCGLGAHRRGQGIPVLTLLVSQCWWDRFGGRTWAGRWVHHPPGHFLHLCMLL